MKRYILGVDGGGTKTHCALFDTNGNKIDLINWGPTNHECIEGGYAGLEKQLSDMFSFILKKNGINMDQLDKCVFGLAGVDTKRQHREISNILKRLGIKDFILCNDAFLGVKAGCKIGHGICLINGTGCSFVGIDPSGKMLQIGGMGPITSDECGANTLGIAVIGSVYAHLFKGGAYTSIKDILFKELEITSKYDYLDIVTDGLASGSININELSRIVFKAANEGDSIALSLLDNMGIDMARSANVIIEELDFEKGKRLDIVLAGSVNVKGENPAAIHKLKHNVLERNREYKINFTTLKCSPVAGAIIWGLQNITGANIFFDKVISQLI